MRDVKNQPKKVKSKISSELEPKEKIDMKGNSGL